VFSVNNEYHILPSCSQDGKLLVGGLHYTVQLDDNPQGKSEHILCCLGCVLTLHFLLIPELTQEGRVPVRYLIFLLNHHCCHTVPSTSPAQKFIIVIKITSKL
jgi:hypothetical protein